MSSSYDRISIFGLLQLNPDLFKELALPDGISSEDVINGILMECMDLEATYTDSKFMEKCIGLWSRKMLPGWTKALAALNAEYNPIHNFDRYEQWSEAGSNSQTGSRSNSSQSAGSTSNTEQTTGSGSESSTNGSTSKNTVNGYNLSEGWADHDKNESSGTSANASQSSAQTTALSSDNSSSTGSENTSQNGTDDRAHSGHLFGNIGITRSQEMVRDEWALRIEINFYDMVIRSFKNAFCVLVY